MPISDAQKTYQTLCNTLSHMKWNFNRDDEKLVVRTNAVGEDLTIYLQIVVSEEKQVMYTKSPLPFKISRQMKEDISLAVSIANYSMLNGCFEYDIESGYIGFKIVVPFGGSLIAEEVCNYMIILSCQMVDKFNDKFQKLANGDMSLEEFEKFVNNHVDLPQA